MRTASLRLPASLQSLSVDDRPEPAIGAGLVKVRWHASTLSVHDYIVVTGSTRNFGKIVADIAVG